MQNKRQTALGTLQAKLSEPSRADFLKSWLQESSSCTHRGVRARILVSVKACRPSTTAGPTRKRASRRPGHFPPPRLVGYTRAGPDTPLASGTLVSRRLARGQGFSRVRRWAASLRRPRCFVVGSSPHPPGTPGQAPLGVRPGRFLQPCGEQGNGILTRRRIQDDGGSRTRL